MPPKALLEAAAELLRRVLSLEHPADAVVSRYFREHRQLGPRERATLAETAYAVLRRKSLFEHLARSGSGARERRLAILGFHGERSFLQAALSEAEKQWLAACDAIAPADLAPEYRHNLPAWLAAALQAELPAADFNALADSLLAPAPLDLRVNTLQAKREAMAQELQAAGLSASPTPHSPWGLRLQGKRPAKARCLHPWRHRGARRRLTTAGPAAGRTPGRNGGRLLRWRRRQNPGPGRGHAQHRPAVRL